MVRLVDLANSAKNKSFSNFNSTMVRLVDKLDREDGLLAIFQFHYGTIGSFSLLSDL